MKLPCSGLLTSIEVGLCIWESGEEANHYFLF